MIRTIGMSNVDRRRLHTRHRHADRQSCFGRMREKWLFVAIEDFGAYFTIGLACFLAF